MISLLRPPKLKWLWFLFLELSALAPASRAQTELHVPAGFTKLQVVEGSEVVLPAWYTLKGEVSSAQPWENPMVQWFLEQEGKDLNQVLAYINGITTSKTGISLAHPMPSRNVSLKLENLQEKDSGSYKCSVNVLDSQGVSKGFTSKTIELIVLVLPAPPSCRLQGVPRVGNNVTLICQSPRSKPAAQYEWERLPPSAHIFFPPVLGEDTYETVYQRA